MAKAARDVWFVNLVEPWKEVPEVGSLNSSHEVGLARPNLRSVAKSCYYTQLHFEVEDIDYGYFKIALVNLFKDKLTDHYDRRMLPR